MGFSKAQAKQFTKLMKNQIGRGWNYMTTEVREAFVAAHCFHVIRGQMTLHVSTEDMDELYQMMLVESDLADPE